MIKVPNEAMTHAGRFHADDVFSAALLKILNPQINIVRRNAVPEGYQGLVFDLGNGAYDHHGKELVIGRMESGMNHLDFYGSNMVVI